MALIGLRVPSEVSQLLGNLNVPGKKEPVATLHITMFYFGEDLPIDELSKITQAIFEEVSKTKPFVIQIDQVTSFPKGAEGVPIICRVNSDGLHNLRDKIEKALRKANILFSEKFEFTPHITLSYSDEEEFEQQIPSIEWEAQKLVLWGGNDYDETLVTTISFASKTAGIVQKFKQLLQVHNVTQRFAAVVDKAKLEQWKKDLRVMTKIYRDIPLDFSWDDDPTREKAKDQFLEAQKLFRVFRDGFTDWVYKVVIPKKDKKDQGRDLSKSAWDFQYTLSLLFPTMHGNIPDLSKLKHEREKNIKRYQVAATKAFKDLDEYLASQGGGPLQRHDQVETMDVGGIRVTIENYGRDEDSEADLHKTLNQLKKWVSGVERAGFPGAVRGLSVTVNFDQREALTNGMYNPTTDTLTLLPLGMAGKDTIRTVTHEVGHRFYFRELPGQARAHWNEVMEAKGIKITKDDIHRFADAVIPKVDPDNPKEMNDETKVFQVALQAAKNESDELRFRELAKLPIVSWDAKTFDRNKYLDLLMSSEGDTVLVEEITEYGRTSPVEAFAECFQLWVLKGPGALGPWTREFFKTICRAGGAKIANSGVEIEDAAVY